MIWYVVGAGRKRYKTEVVRNMIEWCLKLVNSLHAKVIYTFQSSKAEIASNQRCHSEDQS